MNEILSNRGTSKAARLKAQLRKDKPLRKVACQVCREPVYYDDEGEIVKGCWCQKE